MNVFKLLIWMLGTCWVECFGLVELNVLDLLSWMFFGTCWVECFWRLVEWNVLGTCWAECFGDLLSWMFLGTCWVECFGDLYYIFQNVFNLLVLFWCCVRMSCRNVLLSSCGESIHNKASAATRWPLCKYSISLGSSLILVCCSQASTEKIKMNDINIKLSD